MVHSSYKILRWLIGHMSAGHFCGNLLPERHITHGLSAPGVIFSSIFSSFFLQWGVTFSKQSGFNKTFCICHRKGWGGVCGAKSGKQLTLFLWQARKLCRIWQERLHEVPQRKAFIYLLCRTVIYLFIFCYSKTSLHFSASATSLAFPLF